jgi:hypothetical protein
MKLNRRHKSSLQSLLPGVGNVPDAAECEAAPTVTGATGAGAGATGATAVDVAEGAATGGPGAGAISSGTCGAKATLLDLTAPVACIDGFTWWSSSVGAAVVCAARATGATATSPA